MHDVKWIMRNTAILVQDSPTEPRFVIYSALTGSAIAIHKRKCNIGLGVRRLQISPCSKLLACGTYSSNLVIYNNMTQSEVAEKEHPIGISLNPEPDVRQPYVFRERNDDVKYVYINESLSPQPRLIKVPYLPES